MQEISENVLEVYIPPRMEIIIFEEGDIVTCSDPNEGPVVGGN